MSSLARTIRTAIGQQLQHASPADVMKIAGILLESEPKLEVPRVLSTADGRYLRASVDLVTSRHDQLDEAFWAYTVDQETGLVWSHVQGDTESGQSHDASLKLCKALALMPEDTRVVHFDSPTIQQQLSIVDYSKYDPAVDTRYFKGPYGWHWTKTLGVKKDGTPSDYAWAVNLDYGYSFRFRQSYPNHCRAVCPSQSLGFR